MTASSVRQIRREFSFTATAWSSETVLSTPNYLCTFSCDLAPLCLKISRFGLCVAFLSVERLEQLQKPDRKADWKAALAAVEAVQGTHPSRTLMERLIEDDDAWHSMVRSLAQTRAE